MLMATLSTLSSDHLPILIRLQMKTTSAPDLRRTYVKLKKADWDRYRQEVETTLSKRSFPTDCQRDEKIFRTVLLKTASRHIPTGRNRLHEEPVPAEILDMMTRREHQTDTACSWLVCHSATVGGTVRGNTVQIVSTYPASPEARPPSFLGKPAVRSRSMAGGAPTPCGRH